MQPLVTIGLVLLHAIALYGWGRGAERVCRLPATPPPMSVALGLAVSICLGGFLNLTSLAYAWSLWALAVGGLVLAVFHRPRLGPAAFPVTAFAGVVAFVVLVTAIATVVPAPVFNWRDDFEKYFAFPVRMLQTGTVFGSSLSAIGHETLGGQAFLHAYVLALAGPEMLNVVDLGFGLALCLALAGVQQGSGLRSVLVAALAMLTVLLIDPVIVNVSSTFTGAALCLALVLLNAEWNERAPGPGHAIASGLLLAGLGALKTTYVLWGGMAGMCLAVAVARHDRDVRSGARWLGLTAGSAALFGAPWVLMHLPHYLTALDPPLRHPAPAAVATYSIDYFSAAHLDYDIGPLPYTLTVIASLAMSLCALFASHRRPRTWAVRACLAIAVAQALVYVTLLSVVAPRAAGAGTTLRLFSTIAIGNVPALLVLSLKALAPSRLFALGVAFALVPVILFSMESQLRFAQAVRTGSVLAFHTLAGQESYRARNHDVLHGNARRRVAAAQAAIPRGEPVIAWINTPFWLDYSRNPITDIELAGLQTPWATIPAARFIIWEFNGPATPQLSDYRDYAGAPSVTTRRWMDGGYRLSVALIGLARRSQILHDDGTIMVLRTLEPNDLAKAYGP